MTRRARRLAAPFAAGRLHTGRVALRLDEEREGVQLQVWDALADGRVELAIGATQAIPVGGRFAFRDMGMLNWRCVVAAHHPLAGRRGPLSDDLLRGWPSLVWEDTSRLLRR